MRPDRLCADELHAQFLGEGRRLGIEIVDHFQVIRNEPNRRDQHVRHTFPVQAAQVIENVRAKPRLIWPTAPALKHQIPTANSKRFRHQPRCLA
jgi:hypothetical protein